MLTAREIVNKDPGSGYHKMHQKDEILSQWTEAAPFWEKHRETIREMFAPVTQAVIEDARITSGQTILDLATGPGEPALTIAGQIGPEGKVVGADVVPAMVEAARRQAERRGLRNVSFEVASAENLPFPANTFDAVVSRFGIMFFPSPIASMREVLRVLKPGGLIALAVWSYSATNPFHFIVTNVVDRYVPATPMPPDAPDTFRYADPGKLKAILSEAGLNTVSERLLKFSIRASIPVEDFGTFRTEMSERIRTRTTTLSKEQLAELKRDIMEEIRACSSGGAIVFPGEVLIVSGAKNQS